MENKIIQSKNAEKVVERILNYYERNMENGYPEDAIKLEEIVGIPILKEMVIKGYKTLVKGPHIYDIIKLKEHTGVEIPKTLVLEAYKNKIKNARISEYRVVDTYSKEKVERNIEDLKTLIRETRIQIPEKNISNEFKKELKNLHNSYFYPAHGRRQKIKLKFLEEISKKILRKNIVSINGIRDLLSKEIKFYMEKDELSNAKSLANIGNIEIPEETIQQRYAKYILEFDSRNGPKCRFNCLEECLHIKPNVSVIKEVLQGKEEIIRKGYKKLKQKYKGLEDIKFVRESLGIDVPESVFTKDYINLANRGKLKEMKKIEEFTGIKISDDLLRKAQDVFCEHYIKKDTED